MILAGATKLVELAAEASVIPVWFSVYRGSSIGFCAALCIFLAVGRDTNCS